MQILKVMATAAIALYGFFFAPAQNDAAMQKAFSESYGFEYNKKYTEAIASLAKIAADDSYEVNLRLGWLHYQNKNYTQSVKNYQRATELKPYSVEAKLGLVKPLTELESWDKVLQQYEAILKVDEQNYTANYWGGVIQYNRKKYEAAAKMFERIVNLYPFDYDGNHMLAWSYFYLGRKNDASILFNKALLNRPADASCLEGLSKIK